MIRNVKTIALTLLIGGLTVTGCNDSFVNTQPLDQVSGTAVWSDAALAEAFITGIYAGLGQGGFNEQQLASLTDETQFTHPGRNITTITESRSNPADQGWINNTIEWNQMYLRIRACNLALENLAKPGFPNTNNIVERLTGEAKFMRAYYYHQLVRYYGGVPIVDETYKLGEADYTAPRNTMEECINFIAKDCDDAAALLKGRTMALGRANEGAALALKARILTYAASDLYDVATAKAKSSAHAAFSKPELLGYVSGSRTERWTKARNAAKAVLDLPNFGSQMNLAAPVTPTVGTENYMNIALARNGGERDIIFSRLFTNIKQEDGGRQGLFNGPNGYNNWAGNTPIQQMVDDYEMMDGTRFSWTNPTHASAPYANRDPRFYGSILYDGAQWKPRSAANAARDPLGQIQTGRYEVVNSSGAKVTHFGLDTRNSPIEDWNGSYTGYYMRKFIDPNPGIVDQNTWQQIPWPFLRYTEAVFNYAEACIELGQDAEARTWLNKIRFRAGMPALTESGDALRQRMRNEKRIEMAFEEQRYHDARRWMIAPTTLGRKVQWIAITGTLKPGKTVSLYRYDPTSYDYTYRVAEGDPGKENRAWSDKMYFLPINRDEMNRNNKLVQNPGY
ncbi:RagB/SusD family nutrient uptake outer membrane protein [Rudanella paleaurantiibacter]|uniref:RagB/SusD family nutrient uptake outer membrane protein n=1 Tax=Rudanella paleaurantiibacter TaxID=2614655 RepID=A0A7J5U4H1_9BACT|nr:RagB/SusD family nutrient uptake outer membrane protein [Rudanella paleaurantiibacter]KAB7732738.1 RagB/SusD family nutrient uptake outer membrane protein [Rudanella paleaurantiibacter]